MMILLIVYFAAEVQCALTGLVLPVERTTGLGCIPEGETVSYECTVTDRAGGIASTVWQGDALNCLDSDNQIILAHAQYDSGAIGECGDITAGAVLVNASEYTSRLNLMTPSPQLHGRMINCTLSGRVLIGSDTIQIGQSPPSPTGPVNITSSVQGALDFSWNPPSVPVVGGVGGYMFTVTGVGCGCVSSNVSANTTSVTCSEWSGNGHTCFFEVRTISLDCGFISDPVIGSLKILVPGTPRDLSIKLNYYRNGSLQLAIMHFKAVDTVHLGGNLNNSVSYIVTFMGVMTFHFTNVICGSTSCVLTVHGSQISQNDRYTVSVEAFNVIGKGDPNTITNPIIVNGSLLTIRVDVQSSTVSYHLLSSFVETQGITCVITYGPSPNCAMYTDTSVQKAGGPGTNFTISLSQDVSNGLEYCYTASLTYGSVSMEIVGTFVLECSAKELGSNPSLLNGSYSTTVPNGIVYFDGVAPGSIAQLLCNSGYIASENSRDRTCLLSGLWSGNSQTCILIPTNSLTTETTVAVAVTMTFLLSLGIGTFIVVLTMGRKCYHQKKRKKSEMYTQPGMLTQGNPAYSHVQSQESHDRLIHLQAKLNTPNCEPLYEDPDKFLPYEYEDPDKFLDIKTYENSTD